MPRRIRRAAVAMIGRKELVALRRAMEEAPHGEKGALVKAFAEKYATETRTVYRRMAALPGTVRQRKIRADAGLRKTPLWAVRRRVAFKAMARARISHHAILVKIGDIRRAIKASKAVDWQTGEALQTELWTMFAKIEFALLRNLRAFERRRSTPAATNKNTDATQTKGD